jgi:hypothetical protein
LTYLCGNNNKNQENSFSNSRVCSLKDEVLERSNEVSFPTEHTSSRTNLVILKLWLGVAYLYPKNEK